MTDIKLIALDLDGTLFNPEGIITPMTKAELNRVAAKGVHTVISTGRPFNGLPFSQITDTAIEYAITCNGAAIYRIHGKECLFDNSMTFDIYEPILTYILGRNIHIGLYIDGAGFTPTRCRENIYELDVPESLRAYMIATRTPMEDVFTYVKDCDAKIQKINLNFYPQSDGSFAFREETLAFLKSIPEIEVVGGGFNNFEISKAGVTKSEGIRNLASRLGVTMAETMAMGDSENDYSMITAAGIGVAMGNASPEIKQIADYITAKNTEDGVGEAIKHFIP